jgi:hypothetical protein
LNPITSPAEFRSTVSGWTVPVAKNPPGNAEPFVTNPTSVENP